MESGASARAPASPDILDKRLNKDDVTQIAEKLVNVQAKSYRLGWILRVSKGTLDSIHRRENEDLDCLMQVISEFLKQVEPKPTWRVILKALRNSLLGEDSLAREIELSLTGTAPSNTPPPEMEPLRMASIAAAGSSSTSQMATPSPPKQMGFQWLPSMHRPQDSFSTSQPSHTAVAASGRSFSLPNLQQEHAPLLSTAQQSPEASAGAIRATLPIKVSHFPQGLRQRWRPQDAVAPTSVSSTTLPLTPFSGMPLPQSYMYNLDQLKQNRDALEKEFAELREKVITLLQQRQIELDVVVNTLTSLPASEQDEHESFFDKHLEELERCTKYRRLFSRLNRHWNYLSPQLLYHLVNEFLETTDAKAKVDSYDRHLVSFRIQTLLGLFSEIDKQYMEPVKGFSKIVAKFEKITPKDATLQDVEDFRKIYARHYRLRDFALMLIAKATYGSFLVSFMVPNSVLERLTKDVPTEVLKKFGITQLNVGGLSVYPNLIEVTTIPRSTEIALGSSTPYPLPLTSKDTPEQGQEAVVPCYVHAKNVDFTEKFEHLKKITLQSCELEQVSVPQLATLIKTLPAYKTNQELQFLSDAFDDLELRNNHSEVFVALTFHWKYYLWHKLLDVVVERLNLKAPKAELHAFKRRLRAFFHEVRLLDFIKSEERKRVRPPNFSELVADFDWPKDALLSMVEQFQEQYLDAYDLQRYVMVLASAQHLDHFTITWFIPDVLTKVLKASLPYALLEQFSVFSLTIAGDSLYINHKSEQEGPLPKDHTSFDRTNRRSEVSSAADKREATAPETNREYSYLKAPPPDYFCPVTLNLLLEPHQTSCCGNHLSKETADKIIKEGGACPICKQENLSTTHDKHFQRQVQQLMVFCQYKSRGCKFVANIAEMERHIPDCNFKHRKLGECSAVLSLTIAGDSLYINDKSEKEGQLPKDHTSFDRTSRWSEVSSAADKKEATAPETNREYSYLKAPPHDYFCPVTLNLLLEPHQTSCCGNHLSKEAADKLIEGGGPCPICEQENVSATHDKHFQRQVHQLMVFCQYKSNGCKFVASIAEMEGHIPDCKHSELGSTSGSTSRFRSRSRSRSRFRFSSGPSLVSSLCVSSFCVYLRWYFSSLIWTPKHCAVLYYTHIKPRSFQFRLYIVPQLDAILKEIETDVKEKHSSFERGPVSLFEFDEDEPVIRLKLPADSVSGWTMNLLNNAEMYADDIVKIRTYFIPFQVSVKWSEDQGHPLRELEYDVVITGAKTHELRVVSPDQCTEECETIGRAIYPITPQECEAIGTATSLSSSTTTPITPQDFEGLPPPDLKTLMEFVGVDVQADWKAVGLELGLKITALNTIVGNYNGETKKCMIEVFAQWHDGKTSEYSWKTLAEVLCSKMVDKPGLLPDILNNIKKLSS